MNILEDDILKLEGLITTIGDKDHLRLLETKKGRLVELTYQHRELWFAPDFRVSLSSKLPFNLELHKFACVEPSDGRLDSIKKEMVNFLGDKLHWVPQAVILLSKDGGQEHTFDQQKRHLLTTVYPEASDRTQ